MSIYRLLAASYESIDSLEHLDISTSVCLGKCELKGMTMPMGGTLAKLGELKSSKVGFSGDIFEDYLEILWSNLLLRDAKFKTLKSIVFFITWIPPLSGVWLVLSATL